MKEYRQKNLETLRAANREYGKTPEVRVRNNAATKRRYAKNADYWKTYYAMQKLRPDQTEITRNYSLKKYGMTSADKLAMMAEQDNRCFIQPCGYEFKNISDANVDHCHASGKVRGLLCGHCNRALGLVQDDPERLRCLASYVEAHAV